MATPTPAKTRSIASISRQALALVSLIVGSLQSANAIPGKYGWILQLIGGSIFTVEHALNGNEVSTSLNLPPTVTTELGRLQAALNTLVANLNIQKGNQTNP